MQSTSTTAASLREPRYEVRWICARGDNAGVERVLTQTDSINDARRWAAKWRLSPHVESVSIVERRTGKRLT